MPSHSGSLLLTAAASAVEDGNAEQNKRLRPICQVAHKSLTKRGGTPKIAVAVAWDLRSHGRDKKVIDR